MKLYHKQLHGLKELKLERQKLKSSVSSADFAHRSAINEPGDIQRDSHIDFSELLTGFASNDIILKMLLKLGLPALKKTGEYIGKNAFSLGKEVFGGYLKWKALELSYRWMRLYLYKNQQRKKHD